MILACQTPVFPPATTSAAEVLSETRGKLPIVRGSLWIAKDIGLVKQFDDDPEAVFGGKTTLELPSRLPAPSLPSR
ncbi:MAG TPA: hypothetical protein VJZ76_15000 [Thermoanaerobaculia bacterium]|nr:hypothetical protein [Thermoanaerobaculia bacterium]